MPFWRKSKEVQGTSNKPIPRSISLGNGFTSSSNFENPGSTAGALAEFLAHNESISTVDLGSATPSLDAMVRQKSRLSKTVREVLHDHNALGYLIQYLEARDAVQLIKFWLDVESFRSSASMKITTAYVPPKVDPRKLECVPEDPSDWNGQETKSVEKSLSKLSFTSPSKKSVSSFLEKVKSSTTKAVPLTSSSQGNEINTPKHSSPGTSLGSPDSVKCALNSPNKTQVSSPARHGSGSTESFDSGFCRSDCDNQTCDNADSESAGQSNNGGISQASGSSTLYSSDQLSRAEHIVKTRTEDAVKIYRRYIAPDCTRPVHLPTEIKKNIVEKICAESGVVEPGCFDDAQEKVVDILETEYFPDFLQSEYNAKHQVDVLTSGQVYLTDILYNETALFHFMEFMESENRRSVVEFWMAANNFHQSLLPDAPANQTISDAMILYDKFFSMQATCPLGFSDSVRLQVENNICGEVGPGTDCFSRPLELVMKYLDAMYLIKFLNSHLYKNYLKELMSTIQSSPRGLALSHSSHRLKSSPSQDSISTCSSENLTSNTPSRRSSSNTLLAMGLRPVIKNVDHRDMSIDYTELANPDSLWKRENVKNKIGRMNSLGRYEPGWELAPDMRRSDGTKSATKLTRAVRKLVKNEAHEALKEEMAWQVAEMIVNDVTSVTMPLQSSKKRFNSTGDSGKSDESSMRKSRSESLGFLTSSDFPEMKYF